MFNATKFVVAGVIVALFGGFLLSGVLTQPRDDSRAPVGAQASRPPSTASAGCDEPLVEPGEYEGINDFEDAGQEYRVVVPEGYAELTPAPLILWLAAGGGQLSSNFDWWRPYLDEVDSVFVVVELTRASHRQPSTLIALIDQLDTDYCIDPRRIHAMGSSSSAGTVSALTCDASDRIASFVAAIGAFWPMCGAPERPVPLLAITGDPDRSTVTRTVEKWAEINGCDPEPLVQDLGSGVTREAYQGCVADVLFYDVEGVGHGFIRHECIGPSGACFANEVFDQLVEAERFFAEHPLPE
jgi:acetyl esterase/lipase